MEPTPNRILARYLRVYPALGEHVQGFIQQRHAGALRWPEWCFLPLSSAAAIVQAEAQRQGVPWQQAVADIGNLGAVIAWRQTKGIYAFDPTLYDALARTPMDGRIPVEALFHLPEWCVWIETPDGLGLDSPGFFAHLEHDANAKRAELRVSICAGERLTTLALHLDQATIEEAFAASLAYGAQIAASLGYNLKMSRDEMRDAGKAMAEILGPRLSLLLYLCAENAEIRDEQTRTRTPSNPAPVKVKRGIKLFAASQPTDWEVGFRIGPTIRSAERAQSTAQGGTHTSPRPHVRKAHWHTFWTGPGRTKARVRWLWPTDVGTRKGELPAVIRPVKE